MLPIKSYLMPGVRSVASLRIVVNDSVTFTWVWVYPTIADWSYVACPETEAYCRRNYIGHAEKEYKAIQIGDSLLIHSDCLPMLKDLTTTQGG